MIRVAQENDISDLIQLNIELFAIAESFSGDLNLDRPKSEEKRISWVKNIKNPLGIVLVLELEGKIEGYISGLIKTESWKRINPVAEIDDLYVNPEIRGKGWGRRLMDTFEAECRKDDVKQIYLVTPFGNPHSRSFYEKLEYRPREVQYSKLL